MRATNRNVPNSGLCFTGNVKVLLADKSKIRIEQLKKGDRVLSVNESREIESSIIVQTLRRDVYFKDLFGLNISCSPDDNNPSDSDTMITTEEHLFATTDRWKKVGELEIGERLSYFYKDQCHPNESASSRFPRTIGNIRSYKFKCRMGREIKKKFKDTDKIAVYDIECLPNNNYFVGNSSVLVHGMDAVIPEEKKIMSKEDWEEAMQFLHVHDILLRRKSIDGSSEYKMNDTFAKTILEQYEKCVKKCVKMFKPEDLLDGALIETVMQFTEEGFTSEQMSAVGSVLKPFAEELIKRTERR
jgi:hypothetical protein